MGAKRVLALLGALTVALPAHAQVLPAAAQPGFERLSAALDGADVSIARDHANLTVPGHTVTLRHLARPPWFIVEVQPPDPALAARVQAALPQAFAADPWLLPAPPPPRSPVQRLPSWRLAGRTRAVALVLVLLAGTAAAMVSLVRRSRP